MSADRLVFAVLAAQVAAVRDRIDCSAALDLLWRTNDVLADLAERVRDVAPADPALAVAAAIGGAIEALAFMQAQRHDVARQMAECVITGLDRMALAEPGRASLSAAALAELYVCEEQRRVHDAVARRLAGTPPGEAGA